MAKLKDFSVGGKEYEIHYQKGTLLSSNKHSTTSVSGSGGQSYGNGHTSSVNISSRTTIHDDIFIKDSEGREHSFQLSDFDLAVREGNELAVIWAIKKGEETGEYVLVINNSTNKNFFSNSGIVRLYFTAGSQLAPYGKVLGFGCLGMIAFVVIVLTTGSWLLTFLGLGVGGYFLFKNVVLKFGKNNKNKKDEFKTALLNNIKFSDLK